MPFYHVSFARLASVKLVPPCAFVYMISCLVFFGSCFLRHFFLLAPLAQSLGEVECYAVARALLLSLRALSHIARPHYNAIR